METTPIDCVAPELAALQAAAAGREARIAIRDIRDDISRLRVSLGRLDAGLRADHGALAIAYLSALDFVDDMLPLPLSD